MLRNLQSSRLCVRQQSRTRSARYIISRSYAQYNHNFNQTYANYNPPKTPFAKKLLYATLGLAAFTGMAYYVWWPKHTFPKSVAKILRRGLWAESDRGEYDYQLALKYYLEALEHCKELGMDPLSDEYTGIQLKIGEMFERLNMMEDASLIYNEIASLYLSVLTARGDPELKKRIRDRDHRRHLIQKDLRIAIKLVELSDYNPNLCKAILVTHLIVAQDEVSKLIGDRNGLNLFTKANGGDSSKNGDTKKQEKKKNYTASLENDTILISDAESNEEVARIKKTPEVWEPFTEEFFNAMDLLSAICITTGDLAMAAKVKVNMAEDMLLADVEPSKLLLSQCNLGSLFYMQAEELEAKEIAMKRQFASVANVDYEDIKGSGDLAGNTESGSESESKLRLKLKEKIPAEEQLAYNNVASTREICLELAIKSYEAVLQFAKSIPQDVVKENNKISETVALATYGLGVINLHLSKYDQAERYLRESRVRSKACNYEDLLSEIERELNKLFEEKTALERGERGERPNSIEVDIHMT
ncbi:uncharacterized protein LODBEIA_P15390 [Lodderomyces beijingensis]|uniref:Mitochondrial inner membrane i-AAA protease supercomplex subunit MGR3 n=1 Tax=Lodderomyces beijingensis TaxID=1775926 RepID=A0ABP0ZGL9_9ASCO